MSAYSIEVTQDAREDLSYYSAAERKTIAAAIRQQLTVEPLTETRNRKRLRDNPIAALELRIDRHRVFYEVDEAALTVTIVSVGHKIHNTLYIRGKEVTL
jgi:mRNA-degrading endonuclease RelE of RelBE toxin-antitoxin system